MRKTAAVLTSILLCAAFLAACGDSGSSTSSTKTATVPDGKLGGTAYQTCTPPRISGTTFQSFSAVGIDCAKATEGLNSVYKTNKWAGWTCRQRVSGRSVSTTCTNDSNSGQSFSSTWSVS